MPILRLQKNNLETHTNDYSAAWLSCRWMDAYTTIYAITLLPSFGIDRGYKPGG
jgi:hypothetical protein